MGTNISQHMPLDVTLSTTNNNPFIFNWWEWGILVLVIAGSICVVTWFVIRVVKGKVKVGGLEIAGNDTTKKKESPHLSCKNRGDLGVAIKAIVDWTVQEHDIKTRGILGSQMMKAEEYLLVVKDKCLTWMSTELNNRLDNNSEFASVQHPDYLQYRLSLQEFIVRVKDIIRSACINNGFAAMDETRYKKYVNDMVDRIASFSNRFFTENYMGTLVTQKDIGTAKNLFVDLRELLEGMFDTLRIISRDREAELSNMRSRKKQFIEGTIGLTDM